MKQSQTLNTSQDVTKFSDTISPLALLTKSELEMLISSLLFTSCQLARSNNLAETMLDVDDSFSHFAFPSPINKRLLVNNRLDYSSSLFNPLMDTLVAYYDVLVESRQ